MTEKMSQYSQYVDEGNEFLQNHTNLLNSLLLSKQNARNNFYTDESPEGISDGPQQSGQGISEHGSEQSA